MKMQNLQAGRIIVKVRVAFKDYCSWALGMPSNNDTHDFEV
jgi:hypothetical protein